MDDRLNFGGPMFVPYEDFPVVPGDEGRFVREEEMINRVPATAGDARDRRYRESIFKELRHLENTITDREYEEYMQVKGQLGSDHERIYFLRLNGRDKNQYLKARGIAPKNYYTPQGAFGQANDGAIAVGMGMSDVQGIWGAPDRRDYAGNASSGNERWAYNRGGKLKYIYFEAGQVDGWSEQ